MGRGQESTGERPPPPVCPLAPLPAVRFVLDALLLLALISVFFFFFFSFFLSFLPRSTFRAAAPQASIFLSCSGAAAVCVRSLPHRRCLLFLMMVFPFPRVRGRLDSGRNDPPLPSLAVPASLPCPIRTHSLFFSLPTSGAQPLFFLSLFPLSCHPVLVFSLYFPLPRSALSFDVTVSPGSPFPSFLPSPAQATRVYLTGRLEFEKKELLPLLIMQYGRP